MRTISRLMVGAVLVCLSTLGAQAQASKKTWVSSTGADTGLCPLTAPCASFAYAVTQTIAGGELDVKDSGNYGSFTITQSISVVAPDGVLATVGMAAGSNGITVKAGANDTVTLQGLTIDGHTTGEYGIEIKTAHFTHIKNVSIRNLAVGIISESGTTFIFDSSITGSNEAIVNQFYNSSTIYIGNDTIVGNLQGTYGNINSYGDNRINGNTNSDTQTSVLKNTPHS